ncbi:4Fe-4S binding protein [Methyloversatilis thermotolerans]|uniref:4Fe-4S binding protein n=1 Tax=Methyloversatilis thermotolerans TaxID=1346290 RepID=UPI000381BC33|nr:4Fe-4S binding protein [Methyloversatilis thermotolerans]
MSLKIVANLCTGCSACEPECPNDAISELKNIFVIDPAKCTECEGDFDDPQCLSVCPIDDCILPLETEAAA